MADTADERPPSVPSPRMMRDVMSSFATGITVLTAAGEDWHGMTANAFSSVSLEPPVVLCCVSRAAQMHEAILRSRHFVVNVLGADQADLARYFASRDRPRGKAQFDGIGWRRARYSGAPVLTDTLAWMECELTEVYHGGDHSIFLGTVVDAARRPGDALLFFGGEFHRGMPPTPAAEAALSAGRADASS